MKVSPTPRIIYYGDASHLSAILIPINLSTEQSPRPFHLLMQMKMHQLMSARVKSCLILGTFCVCHMKINLELEL